MLDILERPDARPVSSEDRAQTLEPFISAAQSTLSELAGTAPIVQSVYQVNNPFTLADLSAVIRFTADGSGFLVLSLPHLTATTLARRILAQAAPVLDDALVLDCLAELANVVAGQAKTLLADAPFPMALATPSVVSGSGLPIRPDLETISLTVVFHSDAGNFALQVCLVPNSA